MTGIEIFWICYGVFGICLTIGVAYSVNITSDAEGIGLALIPFIWPLMILAMIVFAIIDYWRIKNGKEPL